ncbi:MAG: hypothetical protein ABJL67_12665 [Sulfitobacter sp.]
MKKVKVDLDCAKKLTARRNYECISICVRMDAYSSWGILLPCVVILDAWAVIFFPPLMYLTTAPLGSLIDAILGKKRKKSPLPTDIREQISQHVEIPERTYFVRGSGVDCRSVSVIFANIVVLPEYFERTLSRPNSQAKLIHEFGHGQYGDYLNIIWLSLLAFIGIAIASAYITGWPDLELGTMSDVLLIVSASYVPMFVIATFNMPAAFRRREHHADFFAYNKAEYQLEALLTHLDKSFAKSKIVNYDPGIHLNNWLFHPTPKRRLAFVVGDQSVPTRGIFLPAILLGMCTLGLMLTTTAVFFDPNVLHLAGAAISVFILLKINGICIDVVKSATLTASGKWLFFLGQGIGLITVVSAILLVSGAGDHVTVTASNGVLVPIPTPVLWGMICASQCFSSLYLILSARLLQNPSAALLSGPIAFIGFLGLYGGVVMTPEASIYAFIWSGGLIAVGAAFLLASIELILWLIARLIFKKSGSRI